MSIKINLQTRLNKPTTIYDSSSEPSPYGQWLLKILAPVVDVEVNGSKIYKSGDFYEDYSPVLYLVLGLGLLAVFYFLRKR